MLPAAVARRSLAVFVLIALCGSSAAMGAEPRDPIARARLLYNSRQFDAAIAAADEGRLIAGRADSADLVAARALLERHRDSSAAEDLTAARERLRRIVPSRLASAERVELIVGLGEALFFDGFPDAAADVFDSLLTNPDRRPLESRERVLDWWASAMDSQARARPEIERQGIYQTMRDRMREELGLNPASAAASYWLSAAARGQGDLQSAWSAAESGWVRAPLAGDGGEGLRGDLDRLVEQALVPERSRASGQPPEMLLMEWQQFKEKWAK